MTTDNAEQPGSSFTKEPRRKDVIKEYIQRVFPCNHRVFDQYDNSMCLLNEDAPTSCWCYPCKERKP